MPAALAAAVQIAQEVAAETGLRRRASTGFWRSRA